MTKSLNNASLRIYLSLCGAWLYIFQFLLLIWCCSSCSEEKPPASLGPPSANTEDSEDKTTDLCEPWEVGSDLKKNTSLYQPAQFLGGPRLSIRTGCFGYWYSLEIVRGSHKAKCERSPFTSSVRKGSCIISSQKKDQNYHVFIFFFLLPTVSCYWGNTPKQKILTHHCAWCLGQLHRACIRVSGRGFALGKPFLRLAMEPDPQTESLQTQNPHYSPFHSPPLWGTIEEIKNDLLESMISRYRARLNINQPALHKILASYCKSSECLFQFQMRMETEHELL